MGARGEGAAAEDSRGLRYEVAECWLCRWGDVKAFECAFFLIAFVFVAITFIGFSALLWPSHVCLGCDLTQEDEIANTLAGELFADAWDT